MPERSRHSSFCSDRTYRRCPLEIVRDPDRLRPVGGRVYSEHDEATLAARMIRDLTVVFSARCEAANTHASISAPLGSLFSLRTHCGIFGIADRAAGTSAFHWFGPGDARRPSVLVAL